MIAGRSPRMEGAQGLEFAQRRSGRSAHEVRTYVPDRYLGGVQVVSGLKLRALTRR